MFVSIMPPSWEKVRGTAKTPSNSAESFNSPGVGVSYTTNWLENETPYEIFADKAGTIKESTKSPFSFFKNNESPDADNLKSVCKGDNSLSKSKIEGGDIPSDVSTL